MNKIYRIVWNIALNVCSVLPKSQSAVKTASGGGGKTLGWFTLTSLAVSLLVVPMAANASVYLVNKGGLLVTLIF